MPNWREHFNVPPVIPPEEKRRIVTRNPTTPPHLVLVCASCDSSFASIDLAYAHQQEFDADEDGHGGFDIYDLDEQES